MIKKNQKIEKKKKEEKYNNFKIQNIEKCVSIIMKIIEY